MRRQAIGAAWVMVLAALVASRAAAEGPSTRGVGGREMRVTVVHARTGEAMEGVQVSGSVGRGREGAFKLLTDSKGECRVPVAADGEVTFFYRKERFAEGIVSLGARYGEAVPEAYTVQMTPGVEIGGVVKDQEGKGVAGVKVGLTFETSAERPGRTTMNYGHVETDADGRWVFGGGPERPERIHIYASHPDFVMESFSHQLGGEQYGEMREKRLETEIRRGVTVAGTVTDEAGRPVAGAEVTPSNSFGLISCTATDAQGRFELRGVEPGRRVIGVRAAGMGPAVREVAVGKDGAGGPVEFRLGKGREVRVRVVDVGGKGVADAGVYVERWGEAKSGWPGLGTIGRTGADGVLVWSGAPAEAVTLGVSAPGMIPVRNVAARAGEGDEVRVVVRPPTVVRGTVVDDESGAAIGAFRVEVTGQKKGDSRWTGIRRDASGGRFEALADFEADVFWVRVTAAGYLPAQSAKVEAKAGGPVVFDVRLKKGRPVTGVVRLPGGKPAAGAKVVLMATYGVSVRNGVLDPQTAQNSAVATTDAAGAFSLPPWEGKLKLLVVHDAGWAEVRQKEVGKSVEVTLQAWCAVAGRVMRRDKPWAGQRVNVRPILYSEKDGMGISVRAYFDYEVKTDAEGRFALDRVVSGELELSREGGDHETRLKLAPGDRRAEVRLGGEGRPVVGKVVTPAELKRELARPLEAHLTRVRPVFIRPGNWESLSEAERTKARETFEASAEYRRWADAVQQIIPTIGADGSLRAEDVPEGDYTLKVYGLEPTPGEPNHLRIAIAADALVQVPAVPGGRSEEAIDVGTLEMKDYQRLAVGQMAPAFVAPTLDGGQFDLAKTRGKYVLLDFWATWCGPCIAEMPRLEQIHRKWGGDGRLVMVSVSLDERIDEPRRFMAERKLPWVQAYAGDLTANPGRRVFGVGAIPSVWVIDPGGRIVAKEVEGERLEETVGRLVGKR